MNDGGRNSAVAAPAQHRWPHSHVLNDKICSGRHVHTQPASSTNASTLHCIANSTMRDASTGLRYASWSLTSIRTGRTRQGIGRSR